MRQYGPQTPGWAASLCLEVGGRLTSNALIFWTDLDKVSLNRPHQSGRTHSGL